MALSRFCLRAFNRFSTSKPPFQGRQSGAVSSGLASLLPNKIFQCSTYAVMTRCLPTETGHAAKAFSDNNSTQKDIALEPSVEDIGLQDESDQKNNTTKNVAKPLVESQSLEFSAFSKTKTSKRHDMAMVFTCTVCETRSAKTMSRESYEKGIVIVRCGGCDNLHLIADRLGWFGEPSSVEDFLRDRGEDIRKGSEDSFELTPEDLAGWKRV